MTKGIASFNAVQRSMKAVANRIEDKEVPLILINEEGTFYNVTDFKLYTEGDAEHPLFIALHFENFDKDTDSGSTPLSDTETLRYFVSVLRAQVKELKEQNKDLTEHNDKLQKAVDEMLLKISKK